MRVAIIGRTEMLYETTLNLINEGYDIPLIITSKEAPEYKKTSEDFKKLADKLGAKFILTSSLEKDEVIREINETPLDIAISLNFTGIISQQIIDLFPLGILNAHGGDLPKYRGNACQAWAIINGEDKIGLCIHKMIGNELDSGKIIARAYLNIDNSTRISQVYDWVSNSVGGLFEEALKALKLNSDYYIECQSTDVEDILRCYPRLPEDGKIDWKQPAESLVRLVNASSEPYSGAFCFLNNEKVIIWRASLYQDSEKYLGICGQVAKIEDEKIVVLSGDGSKVLIEEIEYNNERMVPNNLIKSLRTRLK